MGREKATVTLDRAKVRNAMALTGRRSISDVIDVDLDRLIREEQLRRDVAAYARRPPTDDEIALGDLPVRLDLDDEDVDDDAPYGRRPDGPALT
jgi:hypothetical protein